jgi:hypothetical protein
MRIRIVTDVITPEYDGSKVTAEFVREYIAGCEHVVMPEVDSWDNVVTEDLPDGRVAITADLVPSDPTVTTESIREFVMGADAYWLIPGALVADEFTEIVSA